MTTSDGQSGEGGGPGAPQHAQGAGAASEAPALAIIDAFGGIRPMAKTLGLAVSTVQGWKERAAIPANRHDQIRAAARDHNIAIDPALLRASAGEGGSAPPQTIDAMSEETPAEAPAEASAGAAGEPAGPSAEKSADKAAGGTRSSAATAAAASRRTETQPAPEPRRRSAFLPGMIAGVLLAVAVAAGTISTRAYWAPWVAGVSEGEGAGFAAALAGVEAQLEELRAAIPPDRGPQLSSLDERIATLESAVSQGAGQDPGTGAALESLSAELARMTDRIAALEQDVAAQSSAGGTASAEVISRLTSESQRLDTMLAQQAELAARLASAEADLNAAEAARQDAPGGRETLLLLATLQLRDALQGSGAYEQPLAMLRNLAEGDAGLTGLIEPLERHASTGLPTLRDLQAQFPDVARRLAAIDASQEEDGWSAGVLRRLSEAVNLRRVGFVEGDTPSAVAARAEVKLDGGDLAGALAELDILQGAAAEAAASWRADVKARLAAERAAGGLGALVSQRLAAMAGG